MFRVVLHCDDRKLAELLRAVVGLSVSAPEVTPMVNVEEKHGRLVATTNGSKVEMFGQYLHKRKLTEVNAAVAREVCKAVGMSPSSSSYLLKSAVKGGLLKKCGTGSGTRYEVVK